MEQRRAVAWILCVDQLQQVVDAAHVAFEEHAVGDNRVIDMALGCEVHNDINPRWQMRHGADIFLDEFILRMIEVHVFACGIRLFIQVDDVVATLESEIHEVGSDKAEAAGNEEFFHTCGQFREWVPLLVDREVIDYLYILFHNIYMNSPAEQPETRDWPERQFREVPEGGKTREILQSVLERASAIEEDLWSLEPAELLRRLVPADGENYRSIAHCLMTGRFARHFAACVGVDPGLAERAGVMHDGGRWLNEHRYFRNDVVNDLLLTRLGVYDRVKKALEPNDTFLRPEQYPFRDSFTPEQGVTILADICGRPTDTGDILPFISTIDRHFNTRIPGVFETPWVSERVARTHLNRDMLEQYARVYVNLAYWMAENGADVERVRQLFLEQDAQTPVDTIIFDVGGVLIGDTDPAVIADFCRELNLTEDQLSAAWEGIVRQLQTGAITEDQFWDQFGEKLGRVIPVSQRDLFTRSFNPTMDPRMKDLIKRLKDAGKKLLVLSDTIPQHVRALQEAGIYDGFDEVVTSPEIRCSKKAGSAFQGNSELASFCIAALRAGKPQQGCLFIDDQQMYVHLAQKAQMKGVRFTSFEQLEGDLRANGFLV